MTHKELAWIRSFSLDYLEVGLKGLFDLGMSFEVVPEPVGDGGVEGEGYTCLDLGSARGLEDLLLVGVMGVG